MDIKNIEIGKIKPYPRNTKNHSETQINNVAQSLKENGWVQPIVVDKDNVIIIGHCRYEAAKKLNMETVPCVCADYLSKEKVKALRILDNKLNESEWNEWLELELEDIDLSAYDLDFDMDLSAIEDDGEKTEIIEDEPPEVDEEKEPVAKLGDIWQLGRHRLMCGDSTNEKSVEKLMNGNKADMVFTDPPYGINIVNDKGKVGAGNLAKNKTYSKVINDDTTETAQKSIEILKTFTDKLIIWGGNYFVGFLPFSDSWIIWDKRVDMRSNNFADGEMAWCSFHTPVRIYHQLWNGMIREGEREERVHPTQKPTRLLGDIIRDFTKENEIVIDVFGGSGSTLIACEQLNRNCYMMELDPKYCDVIIERWENLTGEKAVLLNE